jgi:CheY-like chemotaxis protein
LQVIIIIAILKKTKTILNGNEMVAIKQVMVVDDDEDDRDFFREAVAELDPSMRCIQASGGEEALEILRSQAEVLPDYIFLDLNMPKMCGKSLLIALKNDGQLKKIPVIIWSTSSDPKHAQETLQLGADSFLIKPVELGKLCNKIQSLLGSGMAPLAH